MKRGTVIIETHRQYRNHHRHHEKMRGWFSPGGGPAVEVGYDIVRHVLRPVPATLQRVVDEGAITAFTRQDELVVITLLQRMVCPTDVKTKRGGT